MAVQGLDIHQATAPGALTMRALIREQGAEGVTHKVFDWLQEIDILSGGRTPERTLALLAGMVMSKMQHRSVASVLMAFRDGFSSTDKDGKVYGSLSWPTIALWLERHEEMVMNLAHDHHASKVVKGDNYDSRWLDDQEAKSQRVQDQKQRVIDGLRKKLETKR